MEKVSTPTGIGRRKNTFDKYFTLVWSCLNCFGWYENSQLRVFGAQKFLFEREMVADFLGKYLKVHVGLRDIDGRLRGLRFEYETFSFIVITFIKKGC